MRASLTCIPIILVMIMLLMFVLIDQLGNIQTLLVQTCEEAQEEP